MSAAFVERSDIKCQAGTRWQIYQARCLKGTITIYVNPKTYKQKLKMQAFCRLGIYIYICYQMYSTMEATIRKKPTMFRLYEELVTRLKENLLGYGTPYNPDNLRSRDVAA